MNTPINIETLPYLLTIKEVAKIMRVSTLIRRSEMYENDGLIFCCEDCAADSMSDGVRV